MNLTIRQGKGNVTRLTMSEGNITISDLVIDSENTTGPTEAREWTEAMGGTVLFDRADISPRNRGRRP